MVVQDRGYIDTILNERDKQYDLRFKAGEAALNSYKETVTATIAALDRSITKFEEVQRDYSREILALREFRSEAGGKSMGKTALWGYAIGGIGIVLAIGTFALRIFGG